MCIWTFETVVSACGHCLSLNVNAPVVFTLNGMQLEYYVSNAEGTVGVVCGAYNGVPLKHRLPTSATRPASNSSTS